MTIPRVWSHWFFAGSLLCLLGVSSPAFGEEASGDGLAQKVQNPVAKMVSVPFQYNTLFGIGPGNNTAHLLNIQPVVPFSFGDWNIITRTIVPVIYVPRLTAGLDDVPQASGSGSTGGLGDINFTAFLSPANAGKVVWGLGPSISLPTATNDLLGSRQWSAGPSAVVLVNLKPWVLGVFGRQLWSFAGQDDRSGVSQFLIQPFINYNLSDGWYLSSSPTMTSNWEASQGNKWVVPVGGGLGRAFVWDKQPLNVGAQVYYNVVRPEFGAEWQTRLTVQFIF